MSRRKILSVTVSMALLFASISGWATDAQKEAQRRVTFENEAVRVVETTYPPGAAVPMHSHEFPRVVYVIDGGTLQTSGPDGETTPRELSPGDTHWRAPERHGTRNIGSTPLRMVEVEIKGANGGATE